jgi:hypothetical protein
MLEKKVGKLKGTFGRVARSLTAAVLPLFMPIADVFVLLADSIVWLFNNIALPVLRYWGGFFGNIIQGFVVTATWFTKQLAGLKWVVVAIRTAIMLATAGFTLFYARLAAFKLLNLVIALGRVRLSLVGIRSAALAATTALGGTLGLANIVIGAVAIAALVIQDLWTYFNGGDSVIGDLIARFPALKGVIEALKPVINAVGEALPVIWKGIEIGWNAAVWGIAKGIEWTVNGFTWLGGVATSVFQGIFDFIKRSLDGLKDIMRYLGLISSAEEERKAVNKVWTSPTDKARAMLENLNTGISQNVVTNLTNGMPTAPTTPVTAAQKAAVTANTVNSTVVSDTYDIKIDKIVTPDADKVPEALRRAAADNKNRARNAQSGVNP